jgi:light-regulated signal transduction histidine kinase (bacteriophytochrome)/CheY-like chemotaxis protein
MAAALPDPVDLGSCDDVPIHAPGAIQPHGVLLALAPGTLRIEQVAGDTMRLLGATAADLLGQKVAAWLGDVTEKHLRETLQAQRQLTRSLPVFGIVPQRGGRPVDAYIHESDGVVVLELEAAAGEVHQMLALLETMQLHLQPAATTGALCQGIADAVREVTGFDRVGVYRFLPDGSGVVDAEARDPSAAAFLGLHFPASDVPRQARAMYVDTWLRLIPDARSAPAPLSPLLNPTTGRPLDLSRSVLRGIAPIHLHYLANMGVVASMSISLVLQGRLWGLITCHHATPRIVPPRLRVACELFAEMAALRLESQESRQDLDAKRAARQALETLLLHLAGEFDLAGALVRLRPKLRELVHADAVALWLDGKSASLGDAPTDGQIAGLAGWLDGRGEEVFATDRLAALYPPAAAFADRASGLLALSLSPTRRDYVLWFLREQVRTVAWAGNPAKPAMSDTAVDRLSPRGSFAAWQDVARRQSRPWRPLEIETATGLRSRLLDVVMRWIALAAGERAEARQRQDALLSELDHRVKNTLATIQALVSQSRSGGTTLETFLTSFEGRLQSMSRAHSHLTRNRWEGADLRTMIAEELAPELGGAPSRVAIAAGAAVEVRPKAALALGLALHELATNARSHGALARPEGRVQVDWSAPAPNGGSMLLHWRETGGPAVARPARRGFGLDLIEDSLSYELGGPVRIDFPPGGLTCDITLPADQIVAMKLQAAVAAATPAATAAQAAPLQGVRVLLVEDNALIADGLVRLLQMSGASVVGPAARVAAAVALAETADIDVAMLDIDLDGTMVWPAADVLARRGILFFFATGFQASLVMPARFAGRPVLNKPYRVADVMAQLRAGIAPQSA